MRGLLQYSLERISSLQNFYILQKKSIDNKAKRGMKSTRFGYLMDLYFQILTNGSEEERKRESFLQLKKQADQYLEILNINKDKNNDNNEIIYRIKNPHELEKKGFDLNIRRASSAYRQFSDMPVIHGSNTLTMLITRFEEFIAVFISELYVLFPHKYLDKQQISFSEIENLGITTVRKKIIDREIDAIMRESYMEWFKLFETHGMKFESCKDEMNLLKEIYARRNIIVHNSGRVNDVYLKNVPDTQFSVGERLTIDEQYLNNAFCAIKIIVFTILVEAARLIKENKAEYLDEIFSSAYDELLEGQYSVCYNIFHILSKNELLDAETKTMSQINYWLAAKEVVGLSAIKDEIEMFDVSALNRVFLLAKLLLLEKNNEATKVLEDLYNKKEFPISALEEWPLFKKYRNSKEYDAFKNKHPEIFGVASLETGPEAFAADKDVGKSIKKEIADAQLSDL